MLIQCENKKCYIKDHHLLNMEDGKVYCSKCGEVIVNLSSFTLGALKSMGQVERKKKVQKSYSIECEFCKKNDRPILKDKELYCPHCKKCQVSLNAVYKNMLVMKLSSYKEEI
jgi:hypothetical protein